MGNSFKVSYLTTLPKIGNAPRVTIQGDDIQTYRVEFNKKLENGFLIKIAEGYCKTNDTIVSGVRQWYTDWCIRIFDENDKIVFEDEFDPHGKVVFIKIDAYALGDTIAWIPYVEDFRCKHECTVICSTFHNHLLVDSYPNILFVIPNTYIANVYAQYYIGAANDDSLIYSPIKTNENPLQRVASECLGLTPMEFRPDLTNLCKYEPRRIVRKYVTLSEFGSHPEKHWRAENGWQTIVDFLIENDYEVLTISKEKSNLKGVIDMSGESDLIKVAGLIKHAEFHMGVSSGLSWLAWAVDTHVVMVSDSTPKFHEFESDITRISANDLQSIDYGDVEVTKVDEVLNKIKLLLFS
jgi:autotransporter strand-loop-strand O-heptosyltransferase